MGEPTWNMKTKNWDRHDVPNKHACPRCISGTLLRDQLGGETCLNCGHVAKLVIPSRGSAARGMSKKPNTPEFGNTTEELIDTITEAPKS